MPVGTAGSVKAVPQHLLEELDSRIILGNTYHLYLRPGHELIRRMGGLHRFMSWPRAILTDSGGFQVFSLNEFRKVSEDGVEFRSHLDGSTPFFLARAFHGCADRPRRGYRHGLRRMHRVPRRLCPRPPLLDLTLRWALAQQASTSSGTSTSVPGQTPSKAKPPVYSASFRAACIKISAASPPSASSNWISHGYAIGGLSVGEPRELTREVIAETLPLLPADKPRYVMGVGYPDEIAEYAAMGVDMMDCVLPTRAARHGLLFTSRGPPQHQEPPVRRGSGPSRSQVRVPGLPPLQPGLPPPPDGRPGTAFGGPQHSPQSGVLFGHHEKVRASIEETL